MPSLLLQPLIENAIKYAVSAQEEGARIGLSAQALGKYLRVTVSDTGPGLRRMPGESLSDLTLHRSTSTGLGLANIRERLGQAYGDDHTFRILTPGEGGVYRHHRNTARNGRR